MPMQYATNMLVDMSVADLVRRIFNNCGMKDVVVNTPATKPNKVIDPIGKKALTVFVNI
jgi:hypothetical protein